MPKYSFPLVLMVHGAYRYCIEYHIAGPLPRAIHKNISVPTLVIYHRDDTSHTVFITKNGESGIYMFLCIALGSGPAM